jgi:hypothetical protein
MLFAQLQARRGRTIMEAQNPPPKGALKMEGLTYRQEGDYLIPNLAMPEEAPETGRLACGKYALLRRKYLKQHRRVLFANLLTGCKLNGHLAEIEQAANGRMERLTAQMAAQEGVTEELKARDPMQWVGLMNNIRQRAEESVLSDLIYG